jgi:addiction module HigA family antidote
MRKLKPVHPGAILLRDFMKPHGLSSSKLAKELKVSAPTVRAIVRRQRAVSAEMALRLSRYFGTTPELWQKLQMQFDLEVASQKIGKQVKRGIKPLSQTDSGTVRATRVE